MGSTSVGVEIDARVIRAVEVRNPTKPNASVVRAHRIDLPDGAVRNGEVLEPGTVSDALRSLWSANKYSTRNVVLGFGGAKAFARDITIPRAPIEQIREQLPFTVQDMIPLPVAEALLDFYPSGELQTDDGPAVRGILVAAQKDAVRVLVDAVIRARLTPVAVDLLLFGTARAVESVGTSTSNVVIIGVGASSTSLIITESGVPRFVRIIPIGVDDIDAGIARRLQISVGQAEQVKARYGIATANATESDRVPIEAVYASVWDLLSGIRDTLSYFASAHRGVEIDRLSIAGEVLNFPGFDSTLADLTRLQVGRVSIPQSIKSGRPTDLPPSSLDEFTTAYGLALGAPR